MMYEVPLLSRFSLALPVVSAMPEGEPSFSDSCSCQAVDCFESRSRSDLPFRRRVFAAGDLNGDGRPELVEQRVGGRKGELRAHFFSDDLDEVVDVPFQCSEEEEQGWMLKGVFRTSPGVKESYLVFQNEDEIVLRRCDGIELKKSVSLGIGGRYHDVVGFCDFLGRSREDIVCRRDDGSLCIFIMDGLAVKDVRHFPDSVAVSGGWNVVGAGRFHSSALGGPLGDAYTDLVLQHRDGTRKVALFEGTVPQSEHVIWHSGVSDDDALVAVADMNGDGNGDLVCEKADGSVYVVLMEGLQRKTVVPVIGPCKEEDWILL